MFDYGIQTVSWVFQNLGWVAAIAVALFAARFWWLYTYDLGVLAPADQEEVRKAQEADYTSFLSRINAHDPWGDQYRQVTKFILDKVDAFYGDPAKKSAKSPPGIVHYLSASALERSLLLAVVYPLGSLAAVWVFTNQVGPLEEAMGFGPQENGFIRSLIFLPCLLLIVAYLQDKFEIFSFTGRIFAAFTSTFFSYVRSSWVLLTSIILMIWGIGLYIIAARGLLGFAPEEFRVFLNPLAVLSAVAIIFALALRLNTLIILTLNCAIYSLSIFAQFEFSRELTITILNALVSTAMAILAGLIPALKVRFITLFAILFLCILTTFATSKFGQAVEFGDFRIPPIFFLALPALSSIWDWVSIAITRGLLRTGLSRGGFWPLIYALIDLMWALFALFMVTAMVAAAITFFNGIATGTIFDVKALIESIRANPGAPSHYWVYITLGTTLLPSLLNVALGLGALIAATPSLSVWGGNVGLPETRAQITPARRARAAALLTARALAAPALVLVLGAFALDFILAASAEIGLALLSFADVIQLSLG